jgi:hypothetical protein
MPPSQRAMALDLFLQEKEKLLTLESWNSFVRELLIPEDVMPAVVTGRPELIRALPGRDLAAADVKILYELIAGLLETNAALREHAEDVATSMTIWAGAFKQLETVGYQVQRFAQFRRIFPEDAEEASA